MNHKPLNTYKYLTAWNNICQELQEYNIIKPIHNALFLHILITAQKTNWNPIFGLPTTHTMKSIGTTNYKTYKNTLETLKNIGIIKIHQYAKNQHNSTIIQISALEDSTKALLVYLINIIAEKFPDFYGNQQQQNNPLQNYNKSHWIPISKFKKP